MRKIYILISFILVSSVSAFAQYKMEINANYNLPISSDFDSHFKNGFGGTAEVYYFFDESNFSTSLLLGVNSFRGSDEYEKELADGNHTIFDYDYEIHFFTFPIIASGNYTFFRQEKFNLTLGLGAGVVFSEEKKKMIGKYTSDATSKDYSEFAIYPSVGMSYRVADGIAISFKGSYNQTFGALNMSFVGLRLGVIYDI